MSNPHFLLCLCHKCNVKERQNKSSTFYYCTMYIFSVGVGKQINVSSMVWVFSDVYLNIKKA